MTVPNAIVSMACRLEPTNDPAVNPYQIEFAYTLVLLTSVFLLWLRVRPRARRILRWYASAAGAIAFVVMQAQTTSSFSRTDPYGGCRIVLEAALLVTASLLLEILLSQRARGLLPRAVLYAGVRRRDTRDDPRERARDDAA